MTNETVSQVISKVVKTLEERETNPLSAYYDADIYAAITHLEELVDILKEELEQRMK